MTDSGGVKIVIVSSSQAKKSRSRMAALHAKECLMGRHVRGDFIDLNEYDLLTYPKSKGDPILDELVQRFNAADGWVLAVPVYNWGVSGVLLNFLHYALDDDPQRRYRPFVLIGGAGGMKSYLALDGLARTMIYEISAVQVGPAILAAGSLANRDTGLLEPDLQGRLQRAMAALVHYAAAAANLNQQLST